MFFNIFNLDRYQNKIISTIIFSVLINLVYTLSTCKLQSKKLRLTNTYCRRISPVEYKIQTNHHTNIALHNLKAFCADELKRKPINFASNILNKINTENRYIYLILKL